MKLKEYIQGLQDLIDKNPEVADYEVIYSVDDEGNGYGIVNWDPSIGYYDQDNEWIDEDDTEALEDQEIEEMNAVLIN